LCWKCLMFLWSSCLRGSSRQFAMIFRSEMRKRNDLLSFTIFLEFWSLFTEFLSKSSRIFSEFLAMISTTLWLTLIDKNFSVCWTARLIWLRFEKWNGGIFY
jgi:hypothetical protein